MLSIFVILCLSSFLLGKALAGPSVKSGGVAQWKDGANMWKALGLSLTHKHKPSVTLSETADHCSHGPLFLGYSDWARIGYMTQAGPVSLPLVTFYPKIG